MKLNIIKIRIILWSLLVLVILWLLNMAVVPSGKITYVQDFSGDNFFMQKLTPAERVWPVQNGAQKIIGDPAYFALRTPRRFDKAKVTIKFKNNSELPIMEMGLLTDKIVWNYKLQPLQNKIVDQLSRIWPIVRDGQTVLLQKEKRYNSISEFLANRPPQNEIALYNYNLANNFSLKNYQASSADYEIDYALRGPYQFYTYIQNEPLNFDFTFLDLNQNKDRDPIVVNLYSGNKLIKAYSLPDNGLASDNGQVSQEKKMAINLKNLPTGLYKIELRVNNDIVTKDIKTKQSKVAFINKIWLADQGKGGITVYTDSVEFSAQTINPAKLQTITVNNKQLQLGSTYRQFKIATDNSSSSSVKVVLPKDDVMLSGDGVFSFSQIDLFNPDFRKVGSQANIGDSINFVIANYTSPQTTGDYQVSEATFDLSSAYREFNKYSLMISIPGLKTDDGINDNVEIDEIKIELEGVSLWEKMAKIFHF